MRFYDLFKLEEPKQKSLVGTKLALDKYPEALVVHLDEYSASLLGNEVTIITVDVITTYERQQLKKGGKINTLETKILRVLMPGIDDTSYSSSFKINEQMNLSVLRDLIFSWAERYQFRYINVHALDDYCRLFGGLASWF